jgi:hypothetical protein
MAGGSTIVMRVFEALPFRSREHRTGNFGREF